MTHQLNHPIHHVSATVLGSTLLGSTLLNTNIPNNPPTSPPSQGGGAQPSSQGMSSQPSSQGTTSQPSHTMVAPTPNFPYLASLNIPYLTKLMNDPIYMIPLGLTCPPNYLQTSQSLKGNQGEDPTNHIMSFHLWCSSNNIMEDSIRLMIVPENTHWSIFQMVCG
jgi:hypothetical protein